MSSENEGEEDSFQHWTLGNHLKKSGKRSGNGCRSGVGGRYIESERESFTQQLVDYKEVNTCFFIALSSS